MDERVFNVKFYGYWRETNIDSIPSKSGVYCVYGCIYKSEKGVLIHNLIYIGGAIDVKDKIQKHQLKDVWKQHIRNKNHLCFSFGYVDLKNLNRIKVALIFKHKPPANSEFTNKFPFDKTTILLEGEVNLLDAQFTVG